MEEEEQKIDWVHLPPDVEETPLWSCLHDGKLISCVSDRNECTVVLEFSVRHLLEENEEGLTFPMIINGVSAVRATAHLLPNGNLIYPEITSLLERKKLVAEYVPKWREESFSWKEFEEALATDPLQISDAGFVSKNNETTLRFSGYLNGEKFYDVYCDVFVRGSSLSVSRSDGKDFNVDAFIELGQDYWDRFGT